MPQSKAPGDYVFCRADGRPLTASWVAENVLGLERSSGIGPFIQELMDSHVVRPQSA